MIRRNFLVRASAVASAATTGTAGCLGDQSAAGQPDEFDAPYDRWVSANVFSSGTANVQSFDSEALRTGTSMDLGHLPERGLVGQQTERLRTRRRIGTGVNDFGLEEPMTADGPVDRVHELVGYAGTADGGWVFEGSFDAGNVERALDSAGATKETEYGGYAVFSGSELFGVSEDVLLKARPAKESADRLAPIKAVIDAGNGEGTRFSEKYPAYSDLLTALDEGRKMSVLFTPEVRQREEESTTSAGRTDTQSSPDGSTERKPLGVATSMDFGPEQTTFSAALRYASAEDVGDAAAYETDFGHGTDDVTVEITDSLVTITATYARDES